MSNDKSREFKTDADGLIRITAKECERKKWKQRRKIVPLGRSSCSSAVNGSSGREHVIPWVPEAAACSASPLG